MLLNVAENKEVLLDRIKGFLDYTFRLYFYSLILRPPEDQLCYILAEENQLQVHNFPSYQDT